MANATPSRLGQVNASGDTLDLFYQVFSGEVLKFYKRANVTRDKHYVRTIASGKSAGFNIIGSTVSSYHTPGAEIVGSAIKHNEKVINIDGLCISDAFVANLDEAMNHYDVRSRYAERMGNALAINNDQHVLQVGVLAARASATISGDSGGSTLTNANFGTQGSALEAGAFSATQTLAEKDVMGETKYMYLKPAQYYLLAQTTQLMNRDWGGQGSRATATVPLVGDCIPVMTNNLPTTDLSGASTTGENNTYNADYSTTVGLIMTPNAVGTVKLRDLAMEQAYDIRRQGHLMVAKYVMGHGYRIAA